jgi:hypothetical protein
LPPGLPNPLPGRQRTCTTKHRLTTTASHQRQAAARHAWRTNKKGDIAVALLGMSL